ARFHRVQHHIHATGPQGRDDHRAFLVRIRPPDVSVHMKSVQLTMPSPAGNLQPGVDPRRTVAVDDKNAFPHRVTMAMGHQRFLPVTLAVPYHACMDMPFGQSPLLAAGVARLPARVCDARFDADPVHLFPLGFDKQLVRFAEYHPVPASRPWLLLACFEQRLPALFLLLTPQLAEFTRPAVNRGVAHHRGQVQLCPVWRCFPEGLVRCLRQQLRRQPRTNSLALLQAQRLIQKVPITSCPVPIAPPPLGDRPNQRVQRSWLEVLQRQPTGPLTRQLFVQPLQQFPQGRLQELGALLAHVFLQRLEAPTIRRYSKDSAELLHKLGVHGRPHILSRCGGLCEVSLFSRQVANPAWTASYPQKTLLYPRLSRGFLQSAAGLHQKCGRAHFVPALTANCPSCSAGGILVIGLGLLGVSLSGFSPTTDGSQDHSLFTDRLSHHRQEGAL